MILTFEAGFTGAIAVVEFDATVREEHQSSTTVTEYHVERGAKPADHARPENDKISVDVVVTNTPIVAPRWQNNDIRGRFSPVEVTYDTITTIPRVLPGIGLLNSLLPRGSATTSFDVLNFAGEMDRTRTVYEVLTALMASTTLVNLSSPLRDYTNMVLRTLTTPRGPNDGSSLTFSFTAHEIHFVDSEIVTVAATTEKKMTSKGPKPTADVADPGVIRSASKAGAVKLFKAKPNVVRGGDLPP